MPYGQVLELMVALLLIGSAPEKIIKEQFILTVGVFFVVKAFLWIVFCFWFSKKRISKWRNSAVLEWLALVPLIVDFYFLGIADLLRPVSAFFHLPSLTEIVGLFIFLFYLSVTWICIDKAQQQIIVQKRPIFKKLIGKIRLILPILLPYVFLSIFIDLLSNLPIPFVHRIFASSYSEYIFLIILLIVFFFFLPVIIKKLWKCTPLPVSELRSVLEAGLRRQGINFSDILIWDIGEFMACTAAVIGLLPGFRYVLLTPCLIEYLTPQEIEAVLAHEAEHVRKKHILWYLVLMFSFSSIIYVLTKTFINWLFANPFFIKLLLRLWDMPPSLTAFFAVLPLGLLFIFYFRFVIGYFMRNFERQADLAVFKVQGHPYFLISALKKVAYLSGIDLETPNWHHFSIKERIEYLLKTEENKDLLLRHNNKIFYSKVVFLAVTILLFLLPKFMPTEKWRLMAKVNSIEFYYNQLIKQHRDDPKWFLVIGSVFFKNNQYKLAEDAYKKGLRLSPNDPDILNNLAWLYIKAKDKSFFRPKEALLLAIEAARIKPAGYILDTLAECFFINGYIDRAIEIEKRAIEKDKKNAQYYLKQIKKFKDAKLHLSYLLEGENKLLKKVLSS